MVPVTGLGMAPAGFATAGGWLVEAASFHTSAPWVPSLAAKKSVPPTFVKSVGYEVALPG